MRHHHSRRFRIETLENRYMMAAIPGDYHVSGVVDATDYSVWKSNIGFVGESVVDGNGNGVVDAADYTIWRDNLGKTLAVRHEASTCRADGHCHGAGGDKGHALTSHICPPQSGRIVSIATFLIQYLDNKFIGKDGAAYFIWGRSAL